MSAVGLEEVTLEAPHSHGSLAHGADALLPTPVGVDVRAARADEARCSGLVRMVRPVT